MKISAIVVDDSERIQQLLCTILELLDIKILGKAYNGLEAVEIYLKFKPCVVFLDMLMPKYDGIYALKKIKKIDPNAKIIVITADARIEIRKVVNKLGATIMYKPFEFDDIKKAVSKVME